MPERRVSLRITGKVQGVFFRESTKTKARELGLSGWVKNLDDGSVQALAQGETDKIDELIQWAHRGPPAARVTDVSVEDRPPASDLGPFVVER
ncbi:MAG: acylphosphatase [Myxococcaceae bacterium]